MPDIKKVLRGWERCKTCNMSIIESNDSYRDCEYTIGLYCGKDKLINETIELLKEQQNQIWEMQDRTEYLEDMLKEQEAVEPLPQNSNGWVRTIKLWYCGACHSKISRRTSK